MITTWLPAIQPSYENFTQVTLKVSTDLEKPKREVGSANDLHQATHKQPIHNKVFVAESSNLFTVLHWGIGCYNKMLLPYAFIQANLCLFINLCLALSQSLFLAAG